MVPGAIWQLIAIYAYLEPELNRHFVGVLLKEGLIHFTAEGYEPTDRGKLMVDLLCDVPIPTDEDVKQALNSLAN